VTCRDEILAVLPSVTASDGTFTAEQIVAAMRAHGSRYADSTIRTHVTSRMCADAPDHHARVYDDLVRVDRGLYRLRRDAR
jgi:GGDEF domain-containing protein